MSIAFPAPGSVLAARYVVQGVLAEGRNGTVYLAAQPALAREVAIKVVPPARAHALAAEAVTAARVHHAGSVAIHDAGIAPGGEGYLVMGLARGRTLAQLVDEAPLSVARALAITDQILAVLAAVHEAGIVHGDLDATNLLVDETPDGDRVMLVDYGDATCDDARPRTGISADIRAAGKLLFDMLRRSSNIPVAVDYAVMRAVEPDLQRQFPTADAMRRSLRAIAARSAQRSAPASTQVPPQLAA